MRDPSPPPPPAAALALDPPEPRWPSAVLAAAALAVVGLAGATWWVHRPAGAGSLLTAVGQLSGLLAAIAALATVVLMARVPAIERILGVDRGLVWHRRLGVTTVAFTALHIGTVIAGYAAADAAGFLTETWTLLAHYPDMITATVAAVLLGVVTLVSIRAIRHRLQHETWLFGHWYVYPAVALAFGHELSSGASFVGAPAAVLAWTWLHVFVACLAGWYRLVLPAWRMATHRIEVTKVTREAPGVVSLVLHGDRLDDYEVRAGQHIRVRFLTRDGWWQSHPFSLSAVPTSSYWRITIAAAGDHTDDLQTIRKGTRVLVSGAHGALTSAARRRNQVLLVGGGSGITPLRAILESLPHGVDSRVVYRAHDERSLILRQELDSLAAQRGTRVDYLLGPRHPDPDRDVLAPHRLRSLVPDLARRDAYVVGGAGFVDVVETSLLVNGVPRRSIHTERFDA